MTKSILDQRGNVLKTLHSDAHDPDRLVEVTTTDLDPVFQHVRRRREMAAITKPIDGMREVGFIPDFVVEKMMRDGAFHDDAALKRWLNDPANAAFRVHPGRV